MHFTMHAHRNMMFTLQDDEIRLQPVGEKSSTAIKPSWLELRAPLQAVQQHISDMLQKIFKDISARDTDPLAHLHNVGQHILLALSSVAVHVKFLTRRTVPLNSIECSRSETSLSSRIGPKARQKAMQPPLRIAVLECDTPLEGTKAKYGGYGGVFEALLRAGAQSIDDPARLDPKSGLDISTFDVVEKQEYPRLDEIDAVLLTGSRLYPIDPSPRICTDNAPNL